MIVRQLTLKEKIMATVSVREEVKKYYGEVLAGSEDLQTDACCTTDAPPDHIKRMLANLHDEVLAKYYGCGLIAPEVLEGARVLDLGCGSGRDCYVLAQMVGPSGYVVGVDMTEKQLEVAHRHVDYHQNKFGFKRSNVEFHQGYIEQLDALDLEAGSFDVIVSNCVINLSPDKASVLEQAWRLLKPGGEMYFSDVYANRRIPADLARDPMLYGECLGGALYWNDFLTLAKAAGFADPRLVTDRPLAIENPAIAKRLTGIEFYSATWRLFKIPELEPACEDYGQAVVYRGTAPHLPHAFALDAHHYMETGKVFPVCGNSWRMLRNSRFAEHFEFIGTWDTHYGIFEGCGTDVPFASESSVTETSASCC